MRVLHVVGDYPTPQRPHAQTFIQSQVESLRAIGVDCDVLILSGRGLWKYASGHFQVRRKLKSAHYDLVHAHYAYCAVPSLGHGLPVVASFQGSDLYGIPRADGSFSRLNRTMHRLLCRYIVRKSAASIVKAKRMLDVVGPGVHIVPNGVDLARFRPLPAEERAALRHELGFDEATRYVLFAANPNRPNKRFTLAQNAIAYAAGMSAFPIVLRAVFDRPQTEVTRFMQACDALILTSTREGSPNVLKEALASNLRIISVDVGDARERLEGVPGCRVTRDEGATAIGAALAEVLASDEPLGGRSAVSDLELGAMAHRIRAIYAAVCPDS